MKVTMDILGDLEIYESQFHNMLDDKLCSEIHRSVKSYIPSV